MAVSLLALGIDTLILCITLQNLLHKKDADLKVCEGWNEVGGRGVWRRGVSELCISLILAAPLKKSKLRPGQEVVVGSSMHLLYHLACTLEAVSDESVHRWMLLCLQVGSASSNQYRLYS